MNLAPPPNGEMASAMRKIASNAAVRRTVEIAQSLQRDHCGLTFQQEKQR